MSVYPRKFSSQKSTATLTPNWWCQAIHISFLHKFLVLHQFMKVFSLESFPLYGFRTCVTAPTSVCLYSYYQYHDVHVISLLSKPFTQLHWWEGWLSPNWRVSPISDVLSFHLSLLLDLYSWVLAQCFTNVGDDLFLIVKLIVYCKYSPSSKAWL